jgi:hypothetical protein
MRGNGQLASSKREKLQVICNDEIFRFQLASTALDRRQSRKAGRIIIFVTGSGHMGMRSVERIIHS